MIDLHTELQQCRAYLQSIPLAQCRVDFEAAERHQKALPSLYEKDLKLDKNDTRHAQAERELIRARLALESATNEAHGPKSRIAELERILTADARSAKADARINELTARLGDLGATKNLIDAALVKLQRMKSDAQVQLDGFAESGASQLLADAGLPGADVSPPKLADIQKTTHDLAALVVAIEKATGRRSECGAAIQQAAAEQAEAQAELLDARADKLAIVHAAALGMYLPHLVRLRNAETAARGYQSARVDVELLAREINIAAQ